jgi:hypothetical protein
MLLLGADPLGDALIVVVVIVMSEPGDAAYRWLTKSADCVLSAWDALVTDLALETACENSG